MIKKILPILALCALLSSCGEEVLTQNTLSETFRAQDLETFQYNTCAAMRFVKPPVDILFVVDNSGSTLQGSFQQIKDQIAATVSTISNEFDYHIYIAPLHPASGDSLSGYPLVVSDQTTLSTTALNIIQLKDISSQVFFAQASGGTSEPGFQRVYDLINSNRSNKIFRNDAHTVAVMISNGDDTSVMHSIGTNEQQNPAAFAEKKQSFITLADSMQQSSEATSSNSFRFISLVPHRACNGWKEGANYRKMSSDLYTHFGHSNDPGKNSRDLCSGNYADLFSVVNESIHHELVGHKYDHWKISSASEADIQTDDIVVTKVSPNGAEVNIPAGGPNGFEYLGYKSGINTRYEPDEGEPVSGLVIKLNGSAKLSYPDCIKAKTRTPTEYFGFVALPREPQVGTIKIEINGKTLASSSENGWTYLGYRDSKNIKVGGPENVATTPGLFKSGYFIKMHGSAVFSNGDKINVYYKPQAI